MAWILFGGFVALILVRVPIIMAIAASVLLALFNAGYGDSLYIMPQQVLEGVENPALLAVPFFILAGNLMNAVGMTDKIFNFATALVGHFRAGLAQVNVLASMIFAGVSGAAVADIAGLGTVEVKAMRDHGYAADFAAALTVVTATVGPIIPPSIPLVIYAFMSGTSVGRLFLGGVVPGILIGLALMIYVRVVATRRDLPREPRATLRQVRRAAVDGIAALIAPGIIIGAIVTGYTTATESGVLACAYSVLLGFLYRTLDWRRLWDAVAETMMISTVIMIIVGYSAVVGWLLAIEALPQQLAEVILFTTEDKHVFLLLLILFVLAVGCFVEGVPAMLILVPMLLPVIEKFGIDKVHFGLIITFGLLIGIATPPMGIGLYIMVKVANVSFERIAMQVLPMLIPLIIVLFLITYVPGVVLWLPDLVMGPG